MDDHEDSSWPPFSDGYADAYGWIEPEVYEAAGGVWPRAQIFARANLQDVAAGRDLLMKAAVNVSEVYVAQPGRIDDLRAYLYRAYYNLVLYELRRRRLHDKLLEDVSGTWLASSHDSVEELETKILIEQIMQCADPWTRNVFKGLVLGLTFEEMAPALKMSAGGARNKYRDNIKKLIERFGGGESPSDADGNGPHR